MKSVLPILFILLCPALFFSCAKDSAAADTPCPENNGIAFSFSLEIDPLTRVATDDAFKTVFETGDEVGLFVVRRAPGATAPLLPSGNYTDNRKLRLSGGIWTPEGDPIYFPGNGDVLDFYAYWPYAADTDPTAIAYDASSSMYDLLTAYSADIDASESLISLEFAHALTLVEVNLQGGGNEVTMRNVIPAATLNLGAAGSGNEIVSVSEDGRGDFTLPKYKNAKRFRAYLPPQEVEAGELYHITAGSLTAKYNTNATVQLKAGSAKRYAVTSPITDINRLPNSYIVNPGASIDIPILKAYEVWNQETAWSTDNLNSGHAISAELLWMDAEGLIPSGGVELKEDADDRKKSNIRVTTASDITGNAVVAVKINGAIRWTWHIWVTDYDPDKDGKTYEYDNNGDGSTDYVIMDRNLGATTADIENANSTGCYYQGARNMPFPGPASLTSETSFKTLYGHGSTPAVKIEKIWGPDQGQSIRRVLKDPMLFVTSSGEPYSWLTTDSGASTDFGANFWPCEENPYKTVFDPCPEGWMLPPFSNGKSPWAHFPNTYAAYAADAEAKYGWYPLAGRFKFNGSFDAVGSAGICYAGERYGLKTHVLYMWKGKDLQNSHNYSRSNAMPVRCVKENEN